MLRTIQILALSAYLRKIWSSSLPVGTLYDSWGVDPSISFMRYKSVMRLTIRDSISFILNYFMIKNRYTYA
jgi:hypothetical protein